MPKVNGNQRIHFKNNFDDTHIEHQQQMVEDLDYARTGDINLVADDLPPFPQDGDFVEFPFRHLSATVVGAGTWKATDFSNERVLRASMKFFQNKPVYTNHNMMVGNEVGHMGKPKWTTSYTNKKGVKIPAGIDAPVVVDSKLYPKLVRKMSGPVPYVKSASVTIAFEWESSHEFDNVWDFWEKLGTEVDGEMVRRIVTNITEVHESSLVWLGADPYAGILDEDGEVKYVDNSGIVELSASEKVVDEYKKGLFYIDFCLKENNSLSLSNSSGKKPDSNMEELLKLIASKFNTTVQELSEEVVNSFTVSKSEDYNKLKDDASKVVSLEGEIVTLKADNQKITSLQDDKSVLEGKVTSLTNEVAELKPKAEKADGLLKKRQDYAVEMYTKSVNGETDQTILDELSSESSFDSIEAKIKMFGGKALNSFGAACKKCGSNEINFRSSVEEGGNANGKQEEPNDSMGFADQLKLSKI